MVLRLACKLTGQVSLLQRQAVESWFLPTGCLSLTAPDLAPLLCHCDVNQIGFVKAAAFCLGSQFPKVVGQVSSILETWAHFLLSCEMGRVFGWSRGMR